MGLLGFDPELVATSINSVQTAYDSLISAIATEMQTQFVNAMQDKWACNDAQVFFSQFKVVLDKLITESNNTFESVIESMNSAASNWAQNTGSTWSSKTFTRIDKTMDVSGIKENINGVRGVDPQATEISTKLMTIANNAISALTSAQTAVDNCGFIGGSSASSLTASLAKIKTNIENAVNQISGDCASAIEKTTQAYTNLDINISSAFGGGNGGTSAMDAAGNMSTLN